MAPPEGAQLQLAGIHRECLEELPVDGIPAQVAVLEELLDTVEWSAVLAFPGELGAWLALHLAPECQRLQLDGLDLARTRLAVDEPGRRCERVVC